MASGDLLAAQLQIAELQERLQGVRDSKLALSLYLDDGDTQMDGCWEDESAAAAQIEEQIAVLAALAASYESDAAARRLQEEEQASVALAAQLEARAHWDAEAARSDAALALAIAAAPEREWAKRGDLIEKPLDLSRRPPLPDDYAPGASGSSPALKRQASSGARAAASRPSTSSADHHMQRRPPAAAPMGSAAAAAAPAPAAAAGRKGKAPAVPRAAAAGPAGGGVLCAICFEEHPAHSMVAASLPEGQAATSSSQGRCAHAFCMDCMRSYTKSQLQDRKYPISCPDPGCRHTLEHGDVITLLRDSPQDARLYEALMAEHHIDTELRTYCPYPDCSCLLERPDDGNEEGQDAPFECPACRRLFCVSCGTKGWHTGMTCQQFQALPPELRSLEDAAALRMAEANKWKRCPSCGHVVEKSLGCNHVVCRCGCHFCYACGIGYLNTKPSANNVHGTPGCGCELFPVPEDDPAERRDAPVMLRRARPWRNGRPVSRTPCRHSRSIHDCPNGVGRCWFWHDEDDE